jgi:hypothetical protein
VLAWLNNGSSAPTRHDIYTGVSDWRVVAIADIVRNGTPDLIWQSPAGGVAVWLMQGTTVIGARDISPSASVRRVVGAADFDVDGDVDLVWQSPSGTVAIWFMHGLAHVLGGTSIIGRYVRPIPNALFPGWRYSRTP